MITIGGMQAVKKFFQLMKAAGQRWSADKVSVQAAALAFYTGLALSPLLIVLVVIAGLFLNSAEVQATIQTKVADAAGADAAAMVTSMLGGGFDANKGAIAGALSLAMVFFSASSLFAHLERAFNMIWRDSAEIRKGILGFLFARLRAFLMVISIGFLLTLTVLISAVFSAITQFIKRSPDFIQAQFPTLNLSLLDTIVSNALPAIDILLSIFVLTFVFGWMFRSIPRVKLTARDVRGGAIVTAILFIIGKNGLAMYLSRGSVGSAYGAAGSLLILLVWVYYSAQIMFFGAEYTYVDAHRFGSYAAKPDEPPADVISST